MKKLFILAITLSLFTLANPAHADGNSNNSEVACTPVYGMADTCIEHTPVDTGASDSIAYSLAGGSYLAGLLSLIKAKQSII